MDIRSIEHIGIAVKNLETASDFFEKIMESPCLKVEELAEQGVQVAIFKIGSVKIELLTSITPGGVIDKFIEKHGQGIHHLAFLVDDTNDTLKELKHKNIELIDNESKVGAEGLNIGFLNPKDTLGVLMELCSIKK